MVERMLKDIQISDSIVITMAKSHVTDNFLGNWAQACQYMATKIALEFPHKTQSGKRKALNQRRISKVGRGPGGRDGRGRGRRGRGGRDGHGRGRGHGGGQGRGNRVTFNNVDVTNYTRNFSDDEFTCMGAKGRAYVNSRRRGSAQGRGNQGGRGRGGRNPNTDTNRQIEQATVDETNVQEQQIVPYTGTAQESTSESHRAAQGRGAQAGRGFGRGMYGRGGRG